MDNRPTETGVIRHEGFEWQFTLLDGQICVTKYAAPFGLQCGRMIIHPEIHLSFCKLLKAAAKATRGTTP